MNDGLLSQGMSIVVSGMLVLFVLSCFVVKFWHRDPLRLGEKKGLAEEFILVEIAAVSVFMVARMVSLLVREGIAFWESLCFLMFFGLVWYVMVAVTQVPLMWVAIRRQRRKVAE